MQKKLRKMLVMMLVLVLCMAYSGVGMAANTAADLTKLVLSKSQITLEIGDSASVTATGVYKDNSTENVTIKANWSSKNNAVATVYNGTITAVGEGTSTVSVVYGSETESVQVNVTKKVKALTKDVQKLDLKMGESPTIHLTATYTDNSTDTDASNKAEWTVDDGNVVSVVNGKVTPIGPGTATITAAYGRQSVTVPVSVEVVKRLDPSTTQVSMLLSENKPVQIKLKATYPDGNVQNDVSAQAEWSTSNAEVADVIKGEITAYGPGTATITAKYGTQTATIQVDVDKAIRLQASEQNIFLHAKESLPAPIKLEAVYPDKGAVDVTKDATWTSSNEQVVFVKQGAVTANSPGTAVITAKYGDKSVTINVDVDVPRHLDMVEDVALSLSGNKTHQLELKATYANGQTEMVQNKAQWKSSKEDVVYVSNGLLTAYKKGEADITATYAGVSVTTHVAVDMPLKVELSSKKVSLKVNGTYQASIVLDYGANKPAEQVTDKVEWSSSKEEIAKVDENGVVTGVGTGTATITAKYEGKTYTMTVEVGLVSELTSLQSLIILSAGDKKKIDLTAVDDPESPDGLNKRATWKSSSPSVASVDSEGVVTGLKSGKATITAEYGGKKATVQVEVDVISKIDASADFLFLKTAGSAKDKTANVAVTVTFSDGSAKDVSSKAEWKTSNYKVATVVNGKITAVGSGKTTITAKYANKTVRIPVEVDVLKYLQTNEVSLNMSVGQTFNLTATATYSDGSESDVSKPALWKSSRILTATVKDGVVKATGKGKATITVSFGGKSTKVVVNVK
ncbi:Ig-like domain-containing protein [Paenibacillus sp. FSL M7-1455]|uniref:Ig-like domain-containing protein n=1 Tax=Paenibacillus sp. FSL M7-1455 TaxID=2975316 RepID=UPI002BF43393|nr:Ig-like domain-containing protein [Paenibacillus cookii]